MNRPENRLLKILANWFDVHELESLQVSEIAGGLSGARLWQVKSGRNSLCLRCWPSVHPDGGQLAEIHRLLTHVWNAGFTIVPRPRPIRGGQTCVSANTHLWEVSEWLSGETVERPSATQSLTALQTLARFHQHAAAYLPPALGTPDGLKRRQTILSNLQAGQLNHIDAVIGASPSGELRDLSSSIAYEARRLLASTLQVVERAASATLPLQWCLRDIHAGNVLYTGNEVTGLVDFGAATIDSVAGDVARLLGSLASKDNDTWQQGIAAYETIRPLSEPERQVITAYHYGGTVVSAANWLRWLFVEHRTVTDAVSTQKRLLELSERLRFLQPRVT